MKLRTVSWIMLTLSVFSMLTLALNIQPVRASGDIYIRGDGSVDPPTAPISSVDNVTYTFTDNIYDEIVVERDNVVVDGAGYTLQGPGIDPGQLRSKGINLTGRSNVAIKNMEIKAFDYGIYLYYSSNNSIYGNNITNNHGGIHLTESSNWNSIYGNDITKNNRGIELYPSGSNRPSSNYNSVYGNNIINNYDYGMCLGFSSNSTIFGNNITNNRNGIDVYYSSNSSIYENSITNHYYGIELSSYSSNNSIYRNNITNNYYGIDLGSSYNSVYGNNITNNTLGISGSSNSSIHGNNITNNYMGIELFNSSNSSIHGNNITNSSHFGIDLSGSSNNSIYGNNITNSSHFGIILSHASNNIIYHNNFVNNTQQVYDFSWEEGGDYRSSVNIWDDGYPSGGNHWSDYAGDDFHSGPYQNETGFDGISDTPYMIDENNQDNYPLIVPWPLKYKIYSLTVDPVFYDITGTTLIQPSSWTIKFPGGTTRTVSSPVTYNLTQTGNHSIVSIIWKGTEVVPDVTPTTSLTSDMVWSPSINCLLPTSLPISLSSSTSYVGFKVGINGNLTCNEVNLLGAPILLSYSVTGGESWNDITLVNTASDGSYSAVWMPSATGNYLVRATWSGNTTYPGTTTIINLAVIPFKEQNVFSVTSNSTVSKLAFNSTSRELSFTVTGPSGTTGYVNVYIAKTLVDNIADVKVYLDGNQLDYTVTSIDDAWVLHFIYSHSTHTIAISLGLAHFIPPQLISPLSLGILTTALAVATAVMILKTRRGTPSTILDGVFSKTKQPRQP